MKLAEALILRADLQARQEQLRERLSANALVQEGEKPAEEPMELLQELKDNSLKLEELIARINLTNASTLENGESITRLLARREAMGQRISAMRSLLDSASRTVMRTSRQEVKIHPAVNVPELRKETDALSQQLRILDTGIQSLNWLTELK